MHKQLVAFAFVISILLYVHVVSAFNYSGIYSYNKGLNKESGTIYIFHYTSDSAFFMLQAVSGMPDFNTTELKGFISVDSNKGIYTGKDSAEIEFAFTNSSCTLLENSFCSYTFSTRGKYKKTSAKLSRGNSLMPSIADKSGVVKKDSTICYAIPKQTSSPSYILLHQETVQITDEFNGFYLVEVKKKKNEFLWVPKKSIQVRKID
jgi:hypothetical protein